MQKGALAVPGETNAAARPDPEQGRSLKQPELAPGRSHPLVEILRNLVTLREMAEPGWVEGARSPQCINRSRCARRRLLVLKV